MNTSTITPSNIDQHLRGARREIALLSDDALRFTKSYEQQGIAREIAEWKTRLTKLGELKLRMLGW